MTAIRFVAFSGLVVIAAGCAGTRSDPGTSTGLPYQPTAPVVSKSGAGETAVAPFERQTATGQRYIVTATDWRVAAGSWIGTPYQTGGTTRKGADCSGFTQSLYREVTGKEIPRTTTGLWKAGEPVDVMALRPGDLVFFSQVPAGDGVNHVGVVIGEGEFAHASTSQGVRFASYDRGYWQKRFAGARRLLP